MKPSSARLPQTRRGDAVAPVSLSEARSGTLENHTPVEPEVPMHNLPIIVFSHLRWDFVFQRPQHLLSRLAKHRRILFVEEPIHTDGEARWEKSSPAPNVLVCKPYTQGHSHGFTAEQIPLVLPMVKSLIAGENVDEYVIWCYTAMSYPLAAALNPEAVAFDVMDELSAFKGAPPE